ncbi:MAG TPA: GTP 3',8-cyclase MoaA [Pirellulaceae bacterium]|jgi:cyclic pyranopterin phosphate synthase|nr:GTP 3',8-cyclase MoaA [Pirellulaceae bacterium]
MSDAPAGSPFSGPLVDSFGRVHDSLRISVTDRCNIRCFYCMPDERIRFKPRDELLTFEEIARVATVAAKLGVRKLRLTGGEPLLRAGLPTLVQMLGAIQGIEDLALTTNGILLGEQAAALKAAGLQRLNVSLDAISEATFERISRRKGLQRVLDGIEAAIGEGFPKLRLNAVAIRGLTELEVADLVAYAREHDLELRFIEYMPLDAEGKWDREQVLTGAEIRRQIEERYGPLVPAERPDPSQPAVDFRFADGRGLVGFIEPITQPFCGACNRLRITAEGQFRNCLFSMQEWDARALIRGDVLHGTGADDAALARLIRDCVAAKKPGHGIDSPDFLRPDRAMYQIGG